MKRQIEVTYTSKEKKVVEVELPLYRKQSLDFHTIYTRVDPDLTSVSITVADDGEDFEIEFDTHGFDHSEADYTLGRGEYASSEEEFRRARRAMMDALDRLFPDLDSQPTS